MNIHPLSKTMILEALKAANPFLQETPTKGQYFAHAFLDEESDTIHLGDLVAYRHYVEIGCMSIISFEKACGYTVSYVPYENSSANLTPATNAVLTALNSHYFC